MIDKKFSKSFDDCLEQAYLFYDGFLIDEADFTAASPVFAAPFAANFLIDIQAADNMPTNEDDLNEQTLYNQAVEATMELARTHYRKLILYINLAWPNDKMIAKVFGSNLYEKARNSTLKMINLLQDAYIDANSITYKADLIAAGFLQADIDLLNTLAGELTTKNREHERFMRLTYSRTEARIVAFNKVWDKMVKLSETSKVIYKDSPAKVEYYLLYHSIHHGLSKPQNLVAVYDPLNPPNITLSWDAVAEATSYDVFISIRDIGSPSGDYNYLNNFASSPAAIPSILDKRNYFKIKAKNNEDTSVYSDETFVDISPV